MDDEPFDDLLGGVDLLVDSSQESLTNEMANMFTIADENDREGRNDQQETGAIRQKIVMSNNCSVDFSGEKVSTLIKDESTAKDSDVNKTQNSLTEETSSSIQEPMARAVDKIEAVFEVIAESLLSERDSLSFNIRMRQTSTQRTLTPGTERLLLRERRISFPGKTEKEAWHFTVVLRILEMIHEALCANVILTKRDMYYRDPALFGRQVVVDRYVDSIALTFGVPRSTLNVTAAAKGLVAGAFTVFRRDGSNLSDFGDREGMLVPSLRDVLSVEMTAVRWVLVVEKEATFRSITASRFWSTISASGIIVTGKGYPDIATRAVLRFFSTPSPQNGFCSPAVYGLVDFDPDGLAILSTYKHGSFALAHENEALRVPQLKWLGLRSRHPTALAMDGHDMHAAQGLLTLTIRDRKKGRKMLEHDTFTEIDVMRADEGMALHDAESDEPCWRSELQTMLMLNFKAELQLLDSQAGGMCALLETELDGL